MGEDLRERRDFLRERFTALFAPSRERTVPGLSFFNALSEKCGRLRRDRGGKASPGRLARLRFPDPARRPTAEPP